ncbi:hypothetical protein KGQ27_01980 [Patescibacteria group bacterium]|nr:hypothetical protein [Patescibacteria group bacterium]MDE1946313.1 hypothetical protein [Patescibacteria group bacterium]MDE2010765.1 hypothetical protein [Patescibacteria group bacterium]MDE2232650.1 hypothetical protein [Patescibacteria group bacterium]
MSGLLSYFVPRANAAVDAAAFGKVLDPVITNIVNPIIELLFAVGIFVFAFGIVEMIAHGDDSTAREKGRWHMLYGAIGMFIMLSAWGIIHLIANTVKSI